MDKIEVNSDSLSSQRSSFISRQIKDIKSWNFWRAVVAEYVGTCMLFMWSIGIGVHDKNQPSPHLLEVAIGTGFIVAAIINAFLTVSGGHVNPVISIGFFVTGNITCVRFIIYVLTQCLASLSVVLALGQLTSPEMVGNVGLLLPAAGVSDVQACVVEFMLGFGLLVTTLAYADGQRTTEVPPGPMYVGFVVTANILLGARISGGCFNPARSLGPAVIAGVSEHQWVYWVGPLLGGACGALLYDKFFSVTAMSRSTLSSCCIKKSSGNSTDSSVENDCEEVLMSDK